MQESFAVFLVTAVLVSLSGALSPGPMTASVIQHGTRSRLSGIYFSLGHALIEFPLIGMIALGAGSVFEAQGVRVAVGMAGGAYLLYMGRGMLRPVEDPPLENNEPRESSFLAGVLLSVGNPYFLLWWATVGLGLVIAATGFGTAGVVVFALVHWLCDLVWLTFLSAASHRGAERLGRAFNRRVSVACGFALLFFGVFFIWNSLRVIAAA